MTVRHLVILLSFLLMGLSASASDRTGVSSFISSIHYYQAPDEDSLSLAEAQQHFLDGSFVQAQQNYLTFGISPHNVWVRVLLENDTGQTQIQRLTAGQTWLESVTMYLVSAGQVQQQAQAGDGFVADNHLLPAVGIVFYVEVPAGQSELWLNVQSFDPITLPIELLSLDQAQQNDSWAHLGSGLLYGILLALAGFQLVLYSILKHRNALFYSIYIGTFVIMNLGYSGYGFAWLYPHSPIIQNYSTLFVMVLHAVCGLVFMRHFLQLKQLMPRISRMMNTYMLIGVLAMGIFVASQSHLLSALWSFGYITLTTLIMIVTGLLCFSRVKDARYFLFAICCSMVGLCITSLSSLGILPYTHLGYHAAEIGVVCEAIILAIVVTNRLKAIEDERITTKFLATYDPLTKLYNRHAFEQAATKFFQQAKHYHAPLSLAILDLDHFKAINDTYGHHIGDMALKHIADIMKQAARTTDIVARWGGEEIVVLMPNTQLIDAHTLCEELRESISCSPLITADGESIVITASIGLASTKDYPTFSLLFRAADEQMYQAKKLGRNRVKFVLPAHRGKDLSEA